VEPVTGPPLGAPREQYVRQTERPEGADRVPGRFDAGIEAYRQALEAILKGDTAPVMELFLRRDDVTLANPFGPPRLGRAEVEKATKVAAAKLHRRLRTFRGGVEIRDS
ncbi:MAG: hypothetical protein M3404_08880, partial [Actinomycetota bacterium]|nr:hypothetical protein [Actinomycetota bacterium]